MDQSTIRDLSYLLAVIAMTGVLIWGLKHVSRELGRVNPTTNRTLMAEALSEKEGTEAGVDEDTSFSRVSGALGAIGIAATFVGIGYWALHGLFFGTEANLEKISSLSTYFLAGSALFIPYGFNKISKIFN
ncbi:hypothetical protein JSE7799_02911 [Jannaschia seosinensis]|uniref:Uncharacterized protein n=1 Tax=Jannaschia seosinensis TaxID=313367 RepID=A0A0M7BCS2_9RHOB|nr:hypothetical protein [Jannaschia seosinensis]CUH40181.1 hypothetical protein JSE7799_02911 [Jannaschia seosinensis]